MYASLLTNAVFQGIFAAVPLLDARNAGVRGVICVWTGMSDDQVANQYAPIDDDVPEQLRGAHSWRPRVSGIVDR